jgi:hypothetical protein
MARSPSTGWEAIRLECFGGPVACRYPTGRQPTARRGQVDGFTPHRLWTATLGNSLLPELVLAGLEQPGWSSALRRRDSVWRWSGPLE